LPWFSPKKFVREATEADGSRRKATEGDGRRRKRRLERCIKRHKPSLPPPLRDTLNILSVRRAPPLQKTILLKRRGRRRTQADYFSGLLFPIHSPSSHCAYKIALPENPQLTEPNRPKARESSALRLGFLVVDSPPPLPPSKGGQRRTMPDFRGQRRTRDRLLGRSRPPFRTWHDALSRRAAPLFLSDLCLLASIRG
jgi:hypothetical protein